jgi:hypothetical protein
MLICSLVGSIRRTRRQRRMGMRCECKDRLVMATCMYG